MVSSLPQKQNEGAGLQLSGSSRYAGLRLCGVLLAVVAAITMATPGWAEEGGTRRTSAPEHILELQLEKLATEFGVDSGASPGFDNSHFNELLRQARSSLDAARHYLDRDRVCEGTFKLARGVSQLEHAADYGAVRGLEGWRTAEHLASSASLILGAFLEDLIGLAGQGGVDRRSLDQAVEAQTSGGTLRRSGEWTAAAVEFVAGACALSQVPGPDGAVSHASSRLAPRETPIRHAR